MEREIVVQGRAQITVAPDRAVVHVTLDADGSSRDDAYRAAAGPAAEIDAVLARHAGDTGRVVTQALTVQPLTRWRKGEAVRTGWRASRRTMVEVTGFAVLGLLLADLVGAGATLDGPYWQVDDTNDGYDRVRELAARDARRRAEAYASGIGLTLAGINWMAEPGLRSSSGGSVDRGVRMAMAMSARGGAPEEEPVIEIVPADAEIEAAVEVSFSFIAPG